jgi:hypothetical protein
MDSRGHLLMYSYWPDTPWNRFCGKYDQWAGTLAGQLAGIYNNDMLPWVLSIVFILRLEPKPSMNITTPAQLPWYTRLLKNLVKTSTVQTAVHIHVFCSYFAVDCAYYRRMYVWWMQRREYFICRLKIASVKIFTVLQYLGEYSWKLLVLPRSIPNGLKALESHQCSYPWVSESRQSPTWKAFWKHRVDNFSQIFVIKFPDSFRNPWI